MISYSSGSVYRVASISFCHHVRGVRSPFSVRKLRITTLILPVAGLFLLLLPLPSSSLLESKCKRPARHEFIIDQIVYLSWFSIQLRLRLDRVHQNTNNTGRSAGGNQIKTDFEEVKWNPTPASFVSQDNPIQSVIGAVEVFVQEGTHYKHFKWIGSVQVWSYKLYEVGSMKKLRMSSMN